MPCSVAFISAGKLYVAEGDSPPRTIESRFAREMEERQEKARQRHGWKGESDQRIAGVPGAAVWGKQSIAYEDALRVEWSAATRGPQAREVTFAIRVGDLGGIFDNSLTDGDERRLMHRSRLRVEEMDRHPDTGALVYAQETEGGTIRLAVKQLRDNSGTEITEGDAYDQAPSWVPGAPETIVYQSAGLARNQQGFVVGMGPYTIQELELSNGNVTTLLEDADHDLLLPHKLADGSLLFIQRPYEGRKRVHYGKALWDVLLFPIRLIETLFHYLNFMSLIYSGKPLAKSGPVRAAQPDLKKLVLWGRAVEAEKEAKRVNPDEPRQLAPDSWQLLVRKVDGSERVLAKGVLGYDVARDGTIVYTTGKAIFACSTETKPRPVLEHFPIEKVTALD